MGIARIASATDKGLRGNLEDACAALEMRLHGLHELIALLAVICDGVGGCAGGKVGSAMGVRNVITFVAASLAGLIGEGRATSVTPKAFRRVMECALKLANSSIVEAAADRPELKGMSSTVVAALIVDGMAHVASAGDSRCYILRHGRLRQLTTDHSEVQSLVDAGLLTAEQAKSHPLSHTINRYLGQTNKFQPDVRSHRLRPDDTLLLCTDGLTDVLSDAAIAEHMETCHDGIDRLPFHLIKEALAEGTTDNVTVLCCKYQLSVEDRPSYLTHTLTGGYLGELAGALQPTE